jgi:hypothetical protein
MNDHDESLIDKVKNAFGLGDDDEHEHRDRPAAGVDEDRSDGWAGVPETLDGEGGLGNNPGPVGSARYESGSTPADIGGTDHDADGNLDTTRDDRKATEFGGAYGKDDTALPTAAAWDRGEAPPGEASFGDDPVDGPDRRPDV